MLDLILSFAVWWLLGLGIAYYLHKLMLKEGSVQWTWVLIGFLFSVLGLLAFIGVHSVKEKERHNKAVDPRPDESPQYKLKGQATAPPAPSIPVAKEEKKPVKQIEGIPRCPDCGAAVSSSDKKCIECGAKLKD